MPREVKPLRYTVEVFTTDSEGWNGGTTHWCSTKNKAFLDAARYIGTVYAQHGTIREVKIIDGHTGENIHKAGDDLYWLY